MAAPIALPDVYIARPGQPLTVPLAAGFLINDSDPDGDPIVATLITDGVDHGTLTAFPNGTFTYTSTAGYVGTDSFVYRITDGLGGFAEATVTINVVNTPPVAAPDIYSVFSGQVLNVSAAGFLANDSDPDGDPVTAISITSGTTHGTLTAFPAGNFTYTPTAGYTGADRFSYSIGDGFGGTATGTARLFVISQAGVDTLLSDVSLNLTSTPEFLFAENLTLTGTDNLDATGNALANILTGNAGNNSLNGAAGSDTLDGDSGNDTLTGGTGNDVYFVDSVSDVITEAAGDAADEVRTTLTNFILGATAGSANVEHLRNVGVGGFAGTGNSGANSIFGGAGSDTLDGGAGNDTLTGGDGGDYYYVDRADDVIVEGAGGATGYDIVIAGVNYTLSDNVEQLVIQGAATQGTGGSTANYLYGGNSGLSLRLDGGGGDDVLYAGLAGGNTLIGGSGVDTLLIYGGNNQANGGLGSDIYYTYAATDTLSEVGGDGIDTVFANWSITLGAGFEQLVLFGAATTAVGSADANIIYGNGTSGAVTIFGLAGADVIFGGAANDALNGGTENDYLFGLGGINTLIGGGGNDIFYCETFGNTIVENAGEGFDTMYSNSAGISVLAENVEQLILYGPSNGGTGSSLGDYIYGNASANALLLSGGDGFDYILGSSQSDTIIGGFGNDTLDLRGAGAAGNDHVTYNQVGNFGSDTVFGFDSDPAGGQDVIDILGMGYGAGSFGTTIIIQAAGADTLVTFQGATNLAGTIIRLQGVNAATVTSADFVF
jgi:Ca2+-binding RTX toxin-like protein